jgi:ribosomal protein S6
LAAPREYELVLMLDPKLDAPARDALAVEARGQIEASGSLKHENTWGLRKMAYEINHRTEADYRWLRFPPAATASPGPRERSAQGAREDRGEFSDESDDSEE